MLYNRMNGDYDFYTEQFNNIKEKHFNTTNNVIMTELLTLEKVREQNRLRAKKHYHAHINDISDKRKERRVEINKILNKYTKSQENIESEPDIQTNVEVIKEDKVEPIEKTKQTKTKPIEIPKDKKEKKEKKEKKKTIPLSLKRNVWNKHIGEQIGKTLCLCCKLSEITQMNFSCGHVIAENNGGELKLNNLKPICVSCNSSMGTKNMDEFISEYGL